MLNVKKDFKYLQDGKIYLDTGAGALKPDCVVDVIKDFYYNSPINSHSSNSIDGIKVIKKIQETRDLIGELCDCSSDEVVFTSGTTDSLNRVALMLRNHINAGDEIIVTKLNHSSQLVPWLDIANEKGARIVVSENILNDINDKTKVVAFAQQNNTVYQKQDMEAIYKKAKSVGAYVVNDAAQAIIHEKVSLKNADFIAFSGNKLYGPTGIGALIIAKENMKDIEPKFFGGGATSKINDDLTWVTKTQALAYEVGTLNAAGIFGLNEAIKYFNKLVKDGLMEHEHTLVAYAYDELMKLENIDMISQRGDQNILFNIGKFSSQDVVSYLGHKNIVLRSGNHCAKLSRRFNHDLDAIRLSIGAYNSKEDIDIAVNAIKNGGDFLDFI